MSGSQLHPAMASALGKHSAYPDCYDPQLLFGIARAPLAAPGALPCHGEDVWTCYELSWLQPCGKPVVAIGEFRVPADSPRLIESKSFKLYLNSLNQARFAGPQQLQERLEGDLSACAGAPVTAQLMDLDSASRRGIGRWPGRCIDDLPLSGEPLPAGPDAALLRCLGGAPVTESLHSHLLKSNCPVTGQPDWASVRIDYQGPQLDAQSLLGYLISFRQHQDFHEQCIERIYHDLWRCLEPQQLTVQARYLRRGGLDINPCRSSHPCSPDLTRLVRQ